MCFVNPNVVAQPHFPLKQSATMIPFAYCGQGSVSVLLRGWSRCSIWLVGGSDWISTFSLFIGVTII